MVGTSLAEAADALLIARQTLNGAMGIASDAARNAYAGGIPETEIARKLGVNRLTVRKWLGK